MRVPRSTSRTASGSSAATPDAIAIIDGDRRWTFRSLDQRSSRLASALLAAGLQPGDTVGVLLHNRGEYLELTAGLSKAGLVLVPLNPRSTTPELAYVSAHAGLRAIIAEAATQGLLDGLEPLPPLLVGLDDADLPGYEDLLAGGTETDPDIRVPETDPFTIVYTSGTTARPKGVVISHRSRVLTFVASALEWGFGVGATSVAVAPMYHGAGLSYSYGPLFTGGSVTVLPRWDPQKFLHLVQRDRATVSFLVPTHAHMLRALGDEALAGDATASLRTLFFNAAALPVVLKEWVLASLPHVGVHELYGSTEAGAVTNLRPVDAARKAGSVGPPWLFTEVRVVDDDGRPVPTGEPGELFSRSPWLMSGYLHDDAATEACTTPDGFLSAGDVATVDDEGYLAIVDRKKDMIVTGGVNVYPREIEEIIGTHPGVAEVAVVGRADAKWGEAVTAFVVARDAPVDPAELTRLLTGRIASYKIPSEWRTVDGLPRNGAGKVLKRELRTQVGSDPSHG